MEFLFAIFDVKIMAGKAFSDFYLIFSISIIWV